MAGEHVRETLVLASKVASAAGTVAELCWSDDPDVGKTFVSALMMKKLAEKAKNGYYKAAMSGNVRDADGKLIPGDWTLISGRYLIFIRDFQ